MTPQFTYGYDDEKAERNKEKIRDARIHSDYVVAISVAREILGWTIHDRERTTECKADFTKWIKQKIADKL